MLAICPHFCLLFTAFFTFSILAFSFHFTRYRLPMAAPSRPKPQRRAEPATRSVSPSNISPTGSHSLQKQPSPGMDRGKTVANLLPCKFPCSSPKRTTVLQSGGLPPIGWCQWLSSSGWSPTGSHHSVPGRSYSMSNSRILNPPVLLSRQGTTVTLSTKNSQRYEGVVSLTSPEGDKPGVTLKDAREISKPGTPLKDTLFIPSSNIDTWQSGPADAKVPNGDCEYSAPYPWM